MTKARTLRLLGACVLALQIAASTPLAQTHAQTGRTCNVAPSGAEFSRIQAAIDDASCATINVAAGVYREALRVDRTVVIQGNNTDRRLTVLDGNNTFRVVRVLTRGNLTLRNATVQNGFGVDPSDQFSGPRGGGVLNANVVTLENVALKGNSTGLPPGDALGNTIDNNGVMRLDAVSLESGGGCAISSGAESP